MSRYLTPQAAQQLTQRKNWQTPEFRLIFSARDNGHSAAAFHGACDNKGPTLVLVKLLTGQLFGGYTSINWDSSNTTAVDNTAFLFRVDDLGGVEIINATAGSNAINRQAANGPLFGTTDLVVFNPATKGESSSTLTAIYAHANPTILAGRAAPWGPLDVEVLQVLPTTSVAAARINLDNLEYVRGAVSKWRPAHCELVGIQVPNILIVGAHQAGKSSAINTMITALSETDAIHRVARSKQQTTSVTTKLGGYDLRKLGRNKKPLANMILLDTAGWAQTNYTGMIEKILEGRIPHNNSVIIGDPTNKPANAALLPSPEAYTNEVHCIVFVFPYDKTTTDENVESYYTLVQAAHDESLPIVGIITHVDEDPSVKAGGLSTAYSSPTLTASRSRVAATLKITRGEVLPLKNYNIETQPVSDVSVLALLALKAIQQSVDNYFDRIVLRFETKYPLASTS